MSELNREGIDFHAHTIGEGASRMILDCAERISREQGGLRIHVTLAHLESQRDEDIPRFKELGITANFTPHWHGGNDYGTAEQNARLLGTRRAEHLFRAKSMMDAGANVTFSSDEVTLQLLDRWNPFLGIEIGHTRQEVTKGGKSAAVFPPLSERLSIEDLIRGYTINGARALRLDDQIGSLEAGKSADFMVLSEDLFNMDPYEIHSIVPKAVVVRGTCVKGDLGQWNRRAAGAARLQGGTKWGSLTSFPKGNRNPTRRRHVPFRPTKRCAFAMHAVPPLIRWACIVRNAECLRIFTRTATGCKTARFLWRNCIS